MKIRDNKATATLLAAVVVVGGVNVAAYAGNGHAFLLGRHNKETKASHLTNKHKGAALVLKTKKSSPPLKVNSKKLVRHLNADTVDGKSAGALETTAWQFGLSGSGTTSYDWELPNLPKGFYLVTLRIRSSHEDGPPCGVYLEGVAGSGTESGPVVQGAAEMTALIDDRSGSRLRVSCFNTSPWTLYEGSRISLVRVDHVVGAALSPTS